MFFAADLIVTLGYIVFVVIRFVTGEISAMTDWLMGTIWIVSVVGIAKCAAINLLRTNYDMKQRFVLAGADVIKTAALYVLLISYFLKCADSLANFSTDNITSGMTSAFMIASGCVLLGIPLAVYFLSHMALRSCFTIKKPLIYFAVSAGVSLFMLIIMYALLGFMDRMPSVNQDIFGGII